MCQWFKVFYYYYYYYYLPFYDYFYYVFLPIFREYVKITGGNGSLVWQGGYSYSPGLRSFGQVGFGNADNITVQIHLSSYSRLKFQYGIMKQGLFSG